MTKLRLYDKDNTSFPKGTIIFNETYTGVSLRFGKDSIYYNRYINHIKKFLKENKLIIVSPEGSNRRHHRNKEYYNKPRGFEVFVKNITGSQKVYFEKIEEKELE